MFFIDTNTDFIKRFDPAKFFPYINDGFDILQSYFIKKIREMKIFGKVVVSGEEKRMDLISYEIYGDTSYWWILCIFNDVINMDLIENGTVLNYPSITSINELYFDLKSREVQYGAYVK